MTTFFVALGVEAVLFVGSLIITIPVIKSELKQLRRTITEYTQTQKELVEAVIRNEERLNNHIQDTHIHNI